MDKRGNESQMPLPALGPAGPSAIRHLLVVGVWTAEPAWRAVLTENRRQPKRFVDVNKTQGRQVCVFKNYTITIYVNGKMKS